MSTAIAQPAQWRELQRGPLKGDGRMVLKMQVGGKEVHLFKEHYEKLVAGEYSYNWRPTENSVLEIRDSNDNRILPLKWHDTFVY